MKIFLMALALMMAYSLSAQQIDLETERKNNTFVFEYQSIGGYGSVYLESAGKYFYRICYLSSDGKKSWKSDKIKEGPRNNPLIFADEKGFAICPSRSYSESFGKATSTGTYFRFDYEGQLINNGKIAIKNKVLSALKSGGKSWLLVESISNNTVSSAWLPTVYLQEIDPKNFSAIGKPQKLDLPERRYDFGLGHVMTRVKGSVAFYWALAGHDANHLLFYGKKTDATAGKTQFEFIKTDFFGKVVDDFVIDIALENGKFVHRTIVQPNVNESSEAYWSTGQYGTQTIDPGNYGGCYADFSSNALYFYGCFDNEPDYAQTQPEGYFIQKFTLSGKNIWNFQTPDDLIKQGEPYKPWRPTSLLRNATTHQLTLCDFPISVLSIDSLGRNAEYHKMPIFGTKETDQRFTYASIKTRLQPDLYLFHNREILAGNVVQSVFGETKGSILKAFLEKNGHPSATYIIQQNDTTFRVMEIDLEGKMFRFWRVLF